MQGQLRPLTGTQAFRYAFKTRIKTTHISLYHLAEAQHRWHCIM
jgi:hypothetical protein